MDGYYEPGEFKEELESLRNIDEVQEFEVKEKNKFIMAVKGIIKASGDIPVFSVKAKFYDGDLVLHTSKDTISDLEEGDRWAFEVKTRNEDTDSVKLAAKAK